jgi:hypothetical protein
VIASDASFHSKDSGNSFVQEVVYAYQSVELSVIHQNHKVFKPSIEKVLASMREANRAEPTPSGFNLSPQSARAKLN